jgi:hypothetical protein
MQNDERRRSTIAFEATMDRLLADAPLQFPDAQGGQ